MQFCLELGLQIICQRSFSLYILVYVGKAFSDLTNQPHSEVRRVPIARVLGREGKRAKDTFACTKSPQGLFSVNF